ncbi:MAG: S8 family serine peptidase [Planctomycetaceae bacterium]
MPLQTRKDRNTVSYDVCGETVTLHRDPDFVAVRYRNRTARSDRHRVVEECQKLGTFHDRIEVPREEYTLVPVADLRRKPGFRSVRDEVQKSNEVISVTPVYRLGSARVIGTHRLTVGFQPGTKRRRSLLKKHGCRTPNRFAKDHFENEYRIELVDETGDPFDKAAELSALEEIMFAIPELVMIADRPGLMANGDSMSAAPNRYYLELTSALDAWKVQKGNPSIKVAVLDVGVDATHPDLKPQLVASFDAVKDDDFPSVEPTDYHGTACAGLVCGIAASDDGVTGIGNGCSLVAIRIACMKNSQFSINMNDIVQGIRKAWQDLKVDVLSNSWFFPPNQQIANEIARARTSGRVNSDGKALGCVFVAAAGNDNQAVDFPARLDGVLAVSAVGPDGRVKEPGSHGQTWGANFGPEVDISAPGVNLWTTDNVGANGHTDNNFNGTFSGTSAATPLVAGAAALVLSAAPQLTELEVRTILLHTTDVPAGVVVPNDRYGSGNLNVLDAVEAARSQLTTVKGVILQAGDAVSTPDAIRAGCYFLRLNDGSSVALRAYSNSASGPFDALEKRSMARLSQFVGRTVTVSYSHRLDRPSGSILWGVTIHDESA